MEEEWQESALAVSVLGAAVCPPVLGDGQVGSLPSRCMERALQGAIGPAGQVWQPSSQGHPSPGLSAGSLAGSATGGAIFPEILMDGFV